MHFIAIVNLVQKDPAITTIRGNASVKYMTVSLFECKSKVWLGLKQKRDNVVKCVFICCFNLEL